MRFTVEETNLMSIYGADTENQSRTQLISSLEDMRGYIDKSEIDLESLTNSVIGKLKAMTDDEFDEVKEEIVLDFE